MSLIHDALMGLRPTIEDCQAMVHLNLMIFTGNQHNEDYSWNREKVEALDELLAMKYYQVLKTNRLK